MKNGLITDFVGNQYWYLNDKLHREDEPAIIHSDGYQAWCINGEYHREDGPAIIRTDGYQAWYLNGKRHRENGPAIIHSNGTQAFHLNGNEISDAEIKEWQEQYNIPTNHENWNQKHKILFKLRFS